MNFLQRCLVSAVVHSVNMHVTAKVGTHECNGDASINCDGVIAVCMVSKW